jgi:hypothetical protein
MEDLTIGRVTALACHSYETSNYAEWLFRRIASERNLRFEMESVVSPCARPLSPDCIPGDLVYWWEDDSRGRTAQNALRRRLLGRDFADRRYPRRSD